MLQSGPAMLVDGEQLPIAGKPSRLNYLQDGRLLFTEKVVGGQRLVCDGDPGPTFMRLAGLATAGSHYGVFGKHSKGMTLHIDGEEIGQWKAAGDLVMDASGNYAFWASMAGKPVGDPEVKTKLKGEQVLFLNSEPLAYGARLSAPAMGPNGVVAYLEEAGSEWRVWKAGEVVGEHDRALAPKFSADGKRLAWPARTAGRWGLCIDGEIHGDHDEVTAFAVSAAGYAYAAREDKECFVVTDTGRLGPFTSVSTIQVTSDGGFVFVASTSEGKVVSLNGELIGPFEKVGRVGQLGDVVGFRAGPKGAERLYRGTTPSERTFEILSNPVWAEGSLVAFGLAEGEVHRVML